MGWHFLKEVFPRSVDGTEGGQDGACTCREWARRGRAHPKSRVVAWIPNLSQGRGL